MAKANNGKGYRLEKTSSGEEYKIYSTTGRGRRTCFNCGKIISAKIDRCICGYDKAPSINPQKKTPARVVPKKHVELVLQGIKWLKEYGNQTTIEDFCESLKLDWGILEAITSVKELNELKQKKKWVSWVEDCGGKEEAIKIVKRIKEIETNL